MFEHVADQQGKGDPAIAKGELLKARVHRHILLQQGLGVAGKFRPQAHCAGHVIVAERVFLDTDEVQARIAGRMLVEQLPGAEEVHASTKAGFADHHAGVRRQVGKTLSQAGLAEEHVFGFFDAFVDCEIDVVILPRVGAALVVPVDLGVLEEGGHGWLGCSGWTGFYAI
ncbi:hypothetical protein DBADOPDK_01624 [Pseudomonas sp. MM223]|nr:hypothetical protein DBADOPDK_01624 [Pseudomonas sp. MM223]